MELIRGLHNLRPRHRGCVATIGAFDGVHRGHQAVIGEVLARAREAGLPATVIVFEPLPREYFAPVQAPPRLMSFREKVPVLRALGVDRLLRIPGPQFEHLLRRGRIGRGHGMPARDRDSESHGNADPCTATTTRHQPVS